MENGTNKNYTGEFKQTVIEEMRENDLSYHETKRRHGGSGGAMFRDFKEALLQL